MNTRIFTVLPLALAIAACGGNSSSKPETTEPHSNPGNASGNSGDDASIGTDSETEVTDSTNSSDDAGNISSGSGDSNSGSGSGDSNSEDDGSSDANQPRAAYVFDQAELTGEFDLQAQGSLDIELKINDQLGHYEVDYSDDSGFGSVPLYRNSYSINKDSVKDTILVNLGYVPTASYCGDYNLGLDFSIFSQGKEYQQRIPIKYSINLTERLYSVSPSELHQNATTNMVITGCSLDKIRPSQLSFIQGDKEVPVRSSQMQAISPYQLAIKNVQLGPGSWRLVLTAEQGSISHQPLEVYSDEFIGFSATMSWKESNNNQVKRFGWNNDRGELHLLMDGTFFLASPFAAQHIRSIYPTGERTELFTNVSDVVSRVTSEGRTTAYMLSNGALYSVPVGFIAPTEIPLDFGELKVKQPESLTMLADQSLLLKDKKLGAVLIDLKRNHAVVLSDLNKLNAARFVAIESDNKILAVRKNQIDLYNVNTQEVVASYQPFENIDIENVKLAQSGKHIVLAQQGQFELLDLNLDELSSFELDRFDVGNDYSADVSADGQYLYLATEDPVFDKNTRVYQLNMSELSYSGIDMLTGDPAMTLIPDIGSGRQLAISKSGKTLALVGDKGLEIFYQSRF